MCRNHPTGFLAGCNQPASSLHFQTRFHSSRDVPDHIVQNQPWSDLVLADCVRFLGPTDPVRKQAGVQESSGPLLANSSQPIRTGCESDPVCLLGLDH